MRRRTSGLRLKGFINASIEIIKGGIYGYLGILILMIASEFLYKSLGFILILLINIILYVIVKYIKNRRNKNGSNI